MNAVLTQKEPLKTNIIPVYNPRLPANITGFIAAAINMFVLLILSFWVIPDMNNASNRIVVNSRLLEENRGIIEHNQLLLKENSKIMQQIHDDAHEIQRNIKASKEKSNE